MTREMCIKRAFNGAGMSVSISPTGEFKVECCTDLLNKAQEEAMARVADELKVQAESFRLSLSTIVKSRGYVYATFDNNTPSEVAHYLRKTKLGKWMKPLKKELEINALDFEMSLEERMKNHRLDSMANFRNTINKLISKGHMSPKTPIEKVQSGRDLLFLFNPQEG